MNVKESATFIMLVFPQLDKRFMEIGIKICSQKENHGSHIIMKAMA
jgi:hypothetical protein